MRQKRTPSDIAAVAHTALSLENYAQIYACIHQIKNKKIQLADAKSNPPMTWKNLSEALKLHGLSSGRRNKPAILERLELLDIFNPHRSSTDPDDLESDLPMEEMERDLVALGWVDCPLKSADVMETYSKHYVPAPLSKEAPICCSQHLMSIHSDTPRTMSMETTVADNPDKTLIKMDLKSRTEESGEIQDNQMSS